MPSFFVFRRNFSKHWLLLSAFFVLLGAGYAHSTSWAQAETVGASQAFRIDQHYDGQGRANVTATLRQVSTHAYAYVEDSYWNNLGGAGQSQMLAQISDLLAQFDDRVYPTETQFFGSEPNPGIDHDPHILILLDPLLTNAGGYFDSGNLYPKTSNPDSNEREMLYLNVNALGDGRKAASFLAHEFQHMIETNQKDLLHGVGEDTWLNEARSEYAITLAGYNDQFPGSNAERRLQSFLANPSDALTEWRNQPTDYGQSAVFSEYLAEHWPATVISQSLQNSQTGIASLNTALTAAGSSDQFLDVFRDWMIANVLNDPSVNPKYGYSRNGLRTFHVVPNRAIVNLGDNAAVPVSDNFKDWQAHWYEISQFAPGQNNYLRVKFSSPSLTSFTVPYVVYHPDGSKTVVIFNPTDGADTLLVDGTTSDISQVVLMPLKHDQIGGFGGEEPSTNLTFVIDRIASAPVATPTSTITATPTPSTTPNLNVLPTPTVTPAPTVRPADYGLREGDFIRAQGDNDIYIVNAYGYKRLVLSPQICLQYGHLGKRGCFSAVHVVTPSVRDAFQTSWLYTNGETRDGKVYKMETTGEDSAMLHHLQISGADFLAQGGDFHAVFQFNTREQNSYLLGGAYPHF